MKLINIMLVSIYQLMLNDTFNATMVVFKYSAWLIVFNTQVLTPTHCSN